MPAVPKWLAEIFENSVEGVSSAVTPELLPPSQLAWGKNIANRGAKPGTRPSFRYMGTLPTGLVQGASYFGVQGGMGVISVAGLIYRLRIGLNDATFEEIALPWYNSGIVKQVYMQQTVETLVIQDGQSDPILYNGSTAERSVPEDGGVPLGRQMAYGNGRLWVAIGGKELVAGDIRSNVIGSELQFTETNYLSGGGTFYFPNGITGLNFIATTGTSDYGALLIFSNQTCDSLRADITSRDLWAQIPGFITSVLRHTGCASHWSLAQVNQDLYWRDASGGIRSIRSSLADESGAGNAPISREVSRLTDYDSPQLLPFCSTIAFNNRLLMTSSPRLNKRGGVTWGNLIPLDFAPASTMRGKSFPAYDGQWEGLNITHSFQGQFNGKSRAFVVTLNDDDSNSLWEIMPDGRGDIDDDSVVCSEGSSTAERSGITCTVEYARRSFGMPAYRKRLERCDVYLWAMRGNVNMRVYWRSDNNQKWQQWDEFSVCGKDGDPEDPDETVHVWKNLLPQQRPQVKSFTIPSTIDPITKYSLITGFEFQIRLVWTGRVHIYKTVLHSTLLDDPPWSMRHLLSAACADNDVTGNEITYHVSVEPCPFIVITQQPEDVEICPPTVIYDCRQITGQGTLIGYSEYISPSLPPRKYRFKQNTGTAYSFRYSGGDPTCTGDTSNPIMCSYGGWCQYDAITGVLTTGGETICNGSLSSTGCADPAPACDRFVTYTQTVAQASPGACCGLPFGGFTAETQDNLAATISDEDTEDDAIFRANIGEEYEACDCATIPAFKELRGPGDFTFDFRLVQNRVIVMNLQVGVRYQLTKLFLRRLYLSSDPWVELSTVVFFEAETEEEAAGLVIPYTNHPNDSGYETVLAEVSVDFAPEVS